MYPQPNKNLLGLWRGKPYDKQAAKDAKILDNLYVFDLADGCVFIAERARPMQSLVGKAVFDIMSETDIEEMLNYLMSYTDTPLYVNTDLGEALAIPSLVPSSSLGVLIFPTIGKNDFLRIAKQRKYKIKFSKAVTEDKIWRLTKSSLQNEADCLYLWESIQRVFGGLATSPFIRGSITHELEARIYELSHYIGCPVGLMCRLPVFSALDFDVAVFTSFVLLSLTVARKRASKQGASIMLTENDCGVLTCITILNGNRLRRNNPAISHFRDITDRKRLYFDYTYAPELIHMRFCANALEWAFVELKSPLCPDDSAPLPPFVPFD